MAGVGVDPADLRPHRVHRGPLPRLPGPALPDDGAQLRVLGQAARRHGGPLPGARGQSRQDQLQTADINTSQ